MTTTKDTPAESSALKGHLGAFAIIAMVVAAAAPLSTVGAVTPNAILAGNGAAFPIMYAVAALLLFFFAVGFNAMTRYVREAGAFYSYVTLGLGRGLGVAAAYIALLTYTCVQIAVYAFLGFTLGAEVEKYGGPSLPWWFWVLVCICIVGWLGYRNIDLSSKVLAILVTLEIAICFILVAAVVIKGGSSEGLSTAAVNPTQWFQGSPALGLMFGVSGFLGFEATAIYRDEAKDPERTVSRATYGALLVVGTFYAIVAWGIVSAWGDQGVIAKAQEDPSLLLSASFGQYLGSASQDIVQVLLIGSFFACVLSFHNVITRYLHSLALTGAMPARLGVSHPRYKSPAFASLCQTVMGIVITLLLVATGLTPLSQIFNWMVGTSSVGFLLLMLLTCLGVIRYFKISRHDASDWQSLWAPAIGAVGMAIGLGVTIWNLPLLVGSQSMAIWVVVPVILVLVAGIVWTRLRPDVNAEHLRVEAANARSTV